MPQPGSTFFMEDLIGSKIVTAEGQEIGHVVDALISEGPEYCVTHLLYGRSGWLYRLHVFEPITQKFGLHVPSHVIPWEAVERFERFTVTLKSGIAAE